jgi:sarcosine oxidase subunit gamma
MAETVTIGRANPACLVAIRVRAEDAAARTAVTATLGMALPEGPSGPTIAAGARLFWIAPDHFWFAPTDRSGGAESAHLRGALQSHHVSILDVSDSRTVFTISGPGARALMAGGTGVDLHPLTFRPGTAALTRFTDIAVLLTQTEATPSFELFVERAAEDYVSRWLSTGVRHIQIANHRGRKL